MKLAWKLPSGSGLMLLYVILLVFFSLNSEYFLSGSNLINILNNVAVLGVIAIVMTFVIISGGIDLSVASVVALTGVVTVQLFGLGMPTGVAMLGGLMVGVVVGFINGYLITYLKINSLITTLGTMSIARGLAFVYSGGLTSSTSNETFGLLGRGFVSFLGVNIPVPLVIMVILFILAFFILKYTIFGRNVYAIGGNAEASRLAGIKVHKNQMYIYVLSGLFASLGGLILTSQLSAGAPQAATGMELSVIAAVILGGCSLAGGKGTMVGTFLGVIILGTMNNGLTIMNVSSYWQDVARGLILLVAVGMDQFRFKSLSRMLKMFSTHDQRANHPEKTL
jgi:ribose transport system permease protein